MVLADDLLELGRAQAVGKRPRRGLVEPGGGEEIAQPRWPVVQDLAAAIDGDFPERAAGLRGALDVIDVFTGSPLMARITSPFWKPTRAWR